MARTLLPSVVIIDVGPPMITTLEATQRLKTLLPQAQVVVLSVYEAPIYRASAAAAGASAYVTKSKMHTELLPVLTSLLPAPEEMNGLAVNHE
jgi:DNA-binding NarL/FixJ family response regulator